MMNALRRTRGATITGRTLATSIGGAGSGSGAASATTGITATWATGGGAAAIVCGGAAAAAGSAGFAATVAATCCGFGLAATAAAAGAGRVAGLARATSTGAGLRVLRVDALSRARVSSIRMVRLRVPAVVPPNTAPTRCLSPRRSEVTRLNPDIRVYPVLMPSMPSNEFSIVLWLR